MSQIKPLKSTIGKKVIMAVSGILLMLFLIAHLAGNLTLFVSADTFNAYAHKLESLGPLLYVAEAGLLAVFLFHIIAAFQTYAEKRRARPDAYAVSASKKGPSKMTVASKSMIYTGIILLLFIPAHIWMFKFNAGTPHPTTELDGQEVKDIYTTVVNAFANPAVAFGYAGVMFLLGLHLRHGFWSALQSLGAMCPKWSPLIYAAGLLFALALAGGFFILPLYFYFCGAGSCAVSGGAL
ncbi:MAG TPA: succinate dehydrogenase cytochrome b subunit [Kiritimatiellia bacterium]|nr:succinate dehydrogenase cytochrome b subunit [Kiritimatiellia bacterium]HMO99704.1 succinate dehydrogenase cytochrome b subunit [Kiritimatiellia bacterium]HMP97048.1 succinate dehydrogenase cytochrome b subunit [Kiritimatiellia bacterium]